jgi:hypothetical protein
MMTSRGSAGRAIAKLAATLCDSSSSNSLIAVGGSPSLSAPIGQLVGGVLVGQRAGDDVALR